MSTFYHFVKMKLNNTCKRLAPHRYSYRIVFRKNEKQGGYSDVCIDQANLETGKRIARI